MSNRKGNRRSTVRKGAAFSASEVYPDDHPRAGEPVELPRQRRRRRKRVPADHPMPQAAAKRAELMGYGPGRSEPQSPAEARARLMGWQVISDMDPQTARRFLGTQGPLWGEYYVPPEGTPAQIPQGEGSILPLVSASRQIPDMSAEWSGLVEAGKVIEPPYDPWLLVCHVEESGALPQAVDAMATNLTGFGYELEPLFETTDPETGEEIDTPPEAVAEREALELFLTTCNLELGGLLGVLDQVDRDVETIGWGAIEVLRDSDGHVGGMEHVPGYTIRLGKLSSPVQVDAQVRHPVTGKLVRVRRWRRFRLIAQVRDAAVIWFKQYGDPRHVNTATGEVRPAAAGPWGEDPQGNSLEATEIIFRRRYAAHTPYGVPCWIGAIPHVRLEREAGELSLDWFLNAPIGVKLALIAGARWATDSLAAALADLDDSARGMENAWSLIPLEGDPESGGGDNLEGTADQAPRIAVEDMTYTLPPELYHGDDSMIDRSRRRAQEPFRLGAIYYGNSEAESNRAASDTARAIGEEQVFRPIRGRRWESLINGVMLPEMGINLWRVKLRGANAGDTDGVFRGLGPFNEGGGTSANALRRVFAEMTGSPVKLIPEPWADKPLPLVIKLLDKGLDPNLSIREIVGEMDARRQAAQEAAAAAAQAAAGGGPGDDPDDDPAQAVKARGLALGVVREMVQLRQKVIEAMGDDDQVLDLPPEWTAGG